MLRGHHTLRQHYHGLITQLWPKDKERCDVQAKQRSCKVGQPVSVFEEQFKITLLWISKRKVLIWVLFAIAHTLNKNLTHVWATDMTKTSNNVLLYSLRI